MTTSTTTAPHARVSDEERIARATLSMLAEPGDPSFLGLTDEMGGAGFLHALLTEGDRHEELAAVAARLPEADGERELDRAERMGIRFVVPGDEEWPNQLADLNSAGLVQQRGGPPIGLWVKGPVRLDGLGDSLAIVGARSATAYGDQVAGDIAAEVAHHGVPVVSGAAFGIDYAAHRGAVSAGGATVAVLACGADQVYPTAHRDMLEHLGREHAVVSEAPLGGAALRIRFLARNRLIAALSRGTIVVEAAARSGALNTLHWAQRLGRITMGVPGPVTSAASVGVHNQLRSGGAALVTCGADTMELLGAAGEHLFEMPRGPEQVRDRLSQRERQVLDAVPVASSAPSHSVARVAGMPLLKVRRALSVLEGQGLVIHDDIGWHLAEAARA